MSSNEYDGLREKLVKNFTWPSVYMFKFIVPAANEKIARIEALFSESAEILLKESSGGKYISITAKEVMLNPDSVIEIYKKASSIEGVMSL